MKPTIILLTIFSISAVLVIIQPNNVQALQCVYDKDWPNKPCLYPQPSSQSELKQIWDQYYQMKGSIWMEMKKAEMDEAIKYGILKEWYEYGMHSNNFANANVWNYYHVYGQAPDIMLYYNGSVSRNDLYPIMTYYYTSPGEIALLGSLISVAGGVGFFGYKKVSRHNRKDNQNI